MKERVIFSTPESVTVEPPCVQLVSVISNSERKNGIVSIDEDTFANEYILTVENNETVIPVADVCCENLSGPWVDGNTIYENPSNYAEEKTDQILVTTEVFRDPIKVFKSMKRIIEILTLLMLANVTLKLSKCELPISEVEYLGFIVS